MGYILLVVCVVFSFFTLASFIASTVAEDQYLDRSVERLQREISNLKKVNAQLGTSQLVDMLKSKIEAQNTKLTKVTDDLKQAKARFQSTCPAPGELKDECRKAQEDLEEAKQMNSRLTLRIHNQDVTIHEKDAELKDTKTTQRHLQDEAVDLLNKQAEIEGALKKANEALAKERVANAEKATALEKERVVNEEKARALEKERVANEEKARALEEQLRKDLAAATTLNAQQNAKLTEQTSRLEGLEKEKGASNSTILDMRRAFVGAKCLFARGSDIFLHYDDTKADKLMYEESGKEDTAWFTLDDQYKLQYYTKQKYILISKDNNKITFSETALSGTSKSFLQFNWESGLKGEFINSNGDKLTRTGSGNNNHVGIQSASSIRGIKVLWTLSLV